MPRCYQTTVAPRNGKSELISPLKSLACSCVPSTSPALTAGLRKVSAQLELNKLRRKRVRTISGAASLTDL
jgi:hypothetical protein